MIEAVSIYNRAGTSHRWYEIEGFKRGSYGDMMRSCCGLMERERHLNRDLGEAFKKCAKCEATRQKHERRLAAAIKRRATPERKS